MPGSSTSVRSIATDLLEDAIGQSLANIGFPLKDFENKNVALKPNFLMTSAVDKAIITHPAFFRAAAKIVRDHGGRVVLVESPAMESVKRVMKKGEYLPILEELDVTVPSNGRKGVILNPDERRFKRFEVLGPVLDADIIINLPKLKTHGLTTITCAVKNLLGLIPGLDKSQWHMKAPGKEAFSEFLLDLNEALLYGSGNPKTILHLVDAVVGQEGNGPGPSGTPGGSVRFWPVRARWPRTLSPPTSLDSTIEPYRVWRAASKGNWACHRPPRSIVSAMTSTGCDWRISNRRDTVYRRPLTTVGPSTARDSGTWLTSKPVPRQENVHTLLPMQGDLPGGSDRKSGWKQERSLLRL